jgi:nitric oxide reductase NorD protein
MYAYESDGKETSVWELPSIENLGSIKPTNANRDGAAIRRTTRHLLEEEARDKLLIIVADGKPSDDSSYTGEYAIKDTARAIAEAEEKGIKVLYLNIDHAQPDYFKELTSNATYARWFKDPKELPRFAYDLVTEFLR